MLAQQGHTHVAGMTFRHAQRPCRAVLDIVRSHADKAILIGIDKTWERYAHTLIAHRGDLLAHIICYQAAWLLLSTRPSLKMK